ncbi:hypothetical protein PMG11_04370 [Penicillium brasilianum]|uniref:Uncharacterized protein n=1 Tax=Penicillium brasilianum TaxID=104259 RepID=A0A0F7VCI8_PENBI|nr:hypothetical protein PMG11_04370 [Penicillium brasilianum]
MDFAVAQDETSTHGYNESLWELSLLLFSGISQLSQPQAVTDVPPENQRVRDALTKFYLWGDGLRNGKLEDILFESEFLRVSITKSLLAIGTNLLEWVPESPRSRTQFFDAFNSQREALGKIVTTLGPEYGSQDDENDEEIDDSSSVTSSGSGRDILDDIIFYIELLMAQVPSLEHVNDQMRQQMRQGSITSSETSVGVSQISQEKGNSSEDHLGRASQLNILGKWFRERFERIGSMDDLNRAVEIAQRVLDCTPDDHPIRAGYLSNLSNWLGARFERIGSMDDLNRAVEVVEKTLDYTALDHPDRAESLKSLSNWLGRRFERTGSMGDLKRGLSVYKEGWNCQTAAPSGLLWEKVVEDCPAFLQNLPIEMKCTVHFVTPDENMRHNFKKDWDRLDGDRTWLKLDIECNISPLFTISIDNKGDFKIRDWSGNLSAAIENALKPLPASNIDSIRTLIHRLEHLARFKMTRELANPDLRTDTPSNLVVISAGSIPKSQSISEQWFLPAEMAELASGVYEVQERAEFCITIKNQSSQPLGCVLLNCLPQVGIEQVFPPVSLRGEPAYILNPGYDKSVVFRMMIASEMRVSALCGIPIVDTLKILVRQTGR